MSYFINHQQFSFTPAQHYFTYCKPELFHRKLACFGWFNWWWVNQMIKAALEKVQQFSVYFYIVIIFGRHKFHGTTFEKSQLLLMQCKYVLKGSKVPLCLCFYCSNSIFTWKYSHWSAKTGKWHKYINIKCHIQVSLAFLSSLLPLQATLQPTPVLVHVLFHKGLSDSSL